MVTRSSGNNTDFNFDNFESLNDTDSNNANLANDHDFDDFFNSDFYNDSDADLFSGEDFEEPGINTTYRGHQNYDNNSKNFKTKIANIPDSIYNKFSGTDNEVARYILMVLIVIMICSIIGGTFAYLTSKDKGSDDSGYNKRLFHMTEGYPDSNSNEETDIEKINTASIDNEDVPLESVSDDEKTIEDTDVVKDDNEAPQVVATPAPTVQPTVSPTLKPTVKPTAAPTAKPVVIPTAQPAVKPEVSNSSSNNNSASDNKAADNAAANNNNNGNNNSNNNVIPENKPEIVCSISPAAKWQENGTYYYQYDIYVSNKTPNDINGWKGVISLSNGAEITNLWGARYTNNTGSIPITPENWNMKIKSNDSAYFKIELKTTSPNALSLSLSVEY